MSNAAEGRYVPAPGCGTVHPYGEEGWRPGGPGQPHEHWVVPAPMKRLTTVGGRDARDRLRFQVALESRMIDGPPPTDAQIAMVLHALADHTMIMEALEFDLPQDGLWPQATSVGRFLHAYGDVMSNAASVASSTPLPTDRPRT